MPATASQLQEILQYAAATVRKRGEAIYNKSTGPDAYPWEQIEMDREGPRSQSLLVPKQSGYGYYSVRLSWTSNNFSYRCNCPAAAESLICKHMVAAALYLLPTAEALEQSGSGKEDAPAGQQLQLHLSVRCKPSMLFANILGWGNYITRTEMAKIMELEKQGDAGRWDFNYKVGRDALHQVAIEYDRAETFSIFCTCHKQGLCQHIKATLGYLNDKHGKSYFASFRNYDAEKIEKLRSLGLSPDDPLAAEVKFHVDQWDNLVATVPEWLVPEQEIGQRLLDTAKRLGVPVALAGNPTELPHLLQFIQPGIVLLTSPTAIPLDLDVIPVSLKNEKFSRLHRSNEAHMEGLRHALAPEVFQALERLSTEGFNAKLKTLGANASLPADAKNLRPFSGIVAQLRQHSYEALQQIWPWLCTLPQGAVFTTDNPKLNNNDATPVTVHPEPLKGYISIALEGNFIVLRLQWRHEDGTSPAAQPAPQGGLLLHHDHHWWLPATTKDITLLEAFPAGMLVMPPTALERVLRYMVPQLRDAYEVQVAESLRPQTVQLPVTPFLHFAEINSKQLALIPRFRYGGYAFSYDPNPQPFLTKGEEGSLQEWLRDTEAETAFAEKVRSLHPDFAAQQSLALFPITFSKALEQSWYQHTLKALEEAGIEVSGISGLQHFRYNTHAAEVTVTEQTPGPGEIDWFDLNIEISFGEQNVSLKEVRRALMNGQAGVRLADGTIGLLPQDFVDRYGALLRLGSESKDGSLRVSKLHFTLIDELHDAVFSEQTRTELAEKKKRLANIESVTTAPAPEGIQATLRPYQLGGYQWLQVLDSLGWGGCLADDMGLGKTLQTITFLQWLKEKTPGAQSLVICPTSLIYNWQAELEKFAPDLSYHIHYGASRVWDEKEPPTADVILTSYGMARSDLQMLRHIRWHYVILDESQAIKNPEAQTTKAVQLIPAQNRICLTGTPLQNNTYDLYAQFQFLNPGLLGNKDFFRTEFANPIDKHGEEGPRKTLRKMLAPFMLRRTKQQVATDLPDKTEMVLWCEMDAEQRAVYDEYRRYYRDSLLQRIDEQGMAGAAIQVLEALLRLRQLCDHPVLVKNQEVKTSESVKLEELRREILENAGGKKVLVFSQFTEMLALIAADFDQAGISFTYLDGKTPAAKRAEAVEKFQTDPEIQVFLISLKAGGVGLNLTAAEYVYFVDTWWNPAVEAQAIDRTHRIGQHNKIVAFRMICKDTVEEKVMLLQARKKALADGLVTEDAGFIKKLTRDDVAFLLA